MKIVNKHQLEDFEIVKSNVLRNYNIYNDAVLRNGDHIAGYEIFKLSKKFLWFKRKRSYAPEVRLETIDEVVDWLYNEASNGLSKPTIKRYLEEE